MKKIIIILCTIFCTVGANAQTSVDSLLNIQQEKVATLESENLKLKSQVNSLEQKVLKLNQSVSAIEGEISQTNEQVGKNSSQISTNAETFDSKITETNSTISHNANNLKLVVIWGAVVVFVVLLISLVVSIIIGRRGKNEVAKLKEQAAQLNEKIVEKMSGEISELQEISKSLSSAPAGEEVDHSLVKALADRITFMEMTLFKMDSSVRGHRHLTRTIEQMKDNLSVYGYEIVEMLGKPYNEGMRVTANFVEDPELEEGKQIITGIIKPQINYKGVMIQSAQITVSQNL